MAHSNTNTEKAYVGYLVEFIRQSDTDLDGEKYNDLECEFERRADGYIIGNRGFWEEDLIVSWVGSGGTEEDLCQILENSEIVESYEKIQILNSEDAPEEFEDEEWNNCGGGTWAYWKEV